MNRIRIRTMVGDVRIYTLYHLREWVTIVTVDGKSESYGSNSMHEAGATHMSQATKYLKLIKK